MPLLEPAAATGYMLTFIAFGARNQKLIYIPLFVDEWSLWVALPVFFCAFFASNSANAQNVKDQLLHGDFENVSVAENPGFLIIAFENRKYRFEPRAVASVLKTAGAYAGEHEIDSLSVLVLHKGLPIVQIITPVDPLNSMIKGEIDYPSWSSTTSVSLDTDVSENKLAEVETSNNTWFQPILSIGLGMRYQLGNYNNLYRFAFDLEPEIHLPLGIGWTLSSTLAIPLYNNFDDNKNIRPVGATLTKELAFGDGVYGGFSAGLFGRNRLGFHGILKTFLHEERISLAIQGGYTTFTDLSGSVPQADIEDQNFVLYTATANYRWVPHDLDLSLEYGQFLYHDYGIRLKAVRYFGETDIGFFMSFTKFGENAGFHFSIPLFPSSYRNKGGIRVRPADKFSVNYRYRGNEYDARTYETGITFGDDMEELYQFFLLKEMKPYLIRDKNSSSKVMSNPVK